MPPVALAAAAEPRRPASEDVPVPEPRPLDAASRATRVVESTQGASATNSCFTVPSSIPDSAPALLSAAVGLAEPVAAPAALMMAPSLDASGVPFTPS